MSDRLFREGGLVNKRMLCVGERMFKAFQNRTLGFAPTTRKALAKPATKATDAKDITVRKAFGACFCTSP